MRYFNVSTDKLYLALTTLPFGTRIYIGPEGEIHTTEASLSPRGLPEDWIFFDRAEGDFDRSDWGMCRDENDRFIVEGLDGSFDSADDALTAAVAEFGVTAETHDELIDRLKERLFPIDDWKYEVRNGDTKLGYEDWWQHKLLEFHHD